MNWIEEFDKLLFPIDSNDLKINEAYDLKTKNLPKSVFKFMKDSDRSLENIKTNKVWLSNPSDFNDPFDSAWNIDFDVVLKGQLETAYFKLAATKWNFSLEMLEEARKSGNPIEYFHRWVDKNQGRDEAQSEKFVKVLEDFRHQKTEEMFRIFFEAMRSRIFICSFSQKVENILMWSHYANYHKGICVEYDCSTEKPNDLNLRFLFPVFYSDDLPDLTRHMKFLLENKRNNNMVYKKAALTKSKSWIYESEWRLLFDDGIRIGGCHAFRPIKAVYIGAKTEETYQEKVITIARSKNIDVYKASLKKERFELEFKKVV